MMLWWDVVGPTSIGENFAEHILHTFIFITCLYLSLSVLWDLPTSMEDNEISLLFQCINSERIYILVATDLDSKRLTHPMVKCATYFCA